MNPIYFIIVIVLMSPGGLTTLGPYTTYEACNRQAEAVNVIIGNMNAICVKVE